MTDRRGKIYAMTEASGTRYQHIFSTADAGASWRRETFGLPANWHYFVLRRIFGDATYFSAMPSEIATDAFEPPLYRSVGGKNAVPMNIKIKIGEWSDVQVGPDGAVYVVASSLIHKSGDGGKTWRALSRVGID